MLHQIITSNDRAAARAAPPSRVRSLKLEAGVHPLDLTERRDTIVIMLSPVRLTAPALPAEVNAGAGWLVHFPAGACRQASLTGPADLLLIDVPPELRLRLHAVAGAGDPSIAQGIALVADHPRIGASVSLLAYLIQSDHAAASQCLPSLVRLLLLDIATEGTAFGSAHEEPRRGALDAAGMASLDRFIEEHIEERLKLEQLSQVAGMSRFHFMRCFKKATGMSPLQYVIAKRVARARAMLGEGRESIAEIAYATGFSSQSHLSVMFKRHVGMTPGHFKRQFAS